MSSQSNIIDPESKLPCVRLSEREKEIYAFLFDQADLDRDGWINPQEARTFFEKCKNLNLVQLGEIWDQVNVNGFGKLNRNAFATALRLVCLVQQFRQPSIEEVLRTKDLPLPDIIGIQYPTPEADSEWKITQSYRASWAPRFSAIPRSDPYFLTGIEVRDFFLKSGLSTNDLALIWSLADVDKDGRLSQDEFVLAMFLVHAKLANKTLPTILPQSLLQSYKSHALIERPEELKQLADDCFTRGDFQNAERYYTSAIDKSLIQVASYFRHRASVKFAQNQIHDAISDCGTALQYNSKYSKGFLQRSHCYLHLGDFQAAQADAEKAEELDPHDDQVKVHVQRIKQARSAQSTANMKLKKEQWEEALEHYKIVVTLCPQSVDAQLGYAKSCVRLQKNLEAKAAVSVILAHHPEHVEASWLRAEITYHTSDISQSRDFISAFLKLAPDHSEALVLRRKIDRLHELKDRGNDSFKHKKYQEAIDAFTDAIKEKDIPNEFCAVLLANRAAAYQHLRQYDEAVADLSKALEINKTYVKALIRRAQCYAELELWEEAAIDYSAIVSLEPFNTDMSTAQRISQQKAAEVKLTNYYTLLAVTPQSTTGQIKKAYHSAALRYHPDKVSGSGTSALKAAKTFKEINKAYEILSDPQKKSQYDFDLSMRSSAAAYAAAGGSYSASGFGGNTNGFGGNSGFTGNGAGGFTSSGYGYGNSTQKPPPFL